MGYVLACTRDTHMVLATHATLPPDITLKRFGSEKPIAMLSAFLSTPAPYRGFPSRSLHPSNPRNRVCHPKSPRGYQSIPPESLPCWTELPLSAQPMSVVDWLELMAIPVHGSLLAPGFEIGPGIHHAHLLATTSLLGLSKMLGPETIPY